MLIYFLEIRSCYYLPDSPPKEFQETLNKAKALVKALQMVKEGLE